MSALPQETFDQLFQKAHTEHGFKDTPVTDELLQQALTNALLAPTAFNCSPMRVIWVKSAEGKEKLAQALMDGNKKQTAEAPVTAIICFDREFEGKLETLMPFVPGVAGYFPQGSDSHKSAMTRNGNLQGGYLLLALRALGLGVGPMSGFDNTKVDELFLEGTTWSSNFLINIGYPNVEARYPRAPRLSFEDASKFA